MNNTIQQDIDRWLRYYANLKDTMMQKSISQVLSRFRDFVDEYVKFITSKNSELGDRGFPDDYLEDSIQAALLEYWEPILRVAQQYQTEEFFIQRNLTREHNNAQNLLEVGYREIEKLSKDSPIEFPQDMLLYFDKIDRAVRYPFGPVLLIGIPYQDAVNNDWTAIPHEIGHHLFWNLRFDIDGKSVVPFEKNEKNPAIFSILTEGDTPEDKDIQETLENWNEEIFADTVGALIGGEDFQNHAFAKVLARTETAKELYIHDNEHPAPYFIPFIRGYALDAPANEEMWRSAGKDRFENREEVEVPLDIGKSKKVDVEALKKELRKLVKSMRTSVSKTFSDSTTETTSVVQSVSQLAKEFVRTGENEDKFDIDLLCKWIEEQVLKNRNGDEELLTEPDNEQPDKKLLRALLVPRILEGRQWTCRKCKKVNQNDRNRRCVYCSTQN